MKWRTMIVLVSLGGAGCAAQDGNQLLIAHEITPATGTCLYTTSNPEALSGYLDPVGSSQYNIALLLHNFMAAPTDNPGTSPGAVSVNQNVVSMLGFNMCWYLASSVGNPGKKGSPLVDCSKLPGAQRAFVPSSASIDPGTDGIATAHILTTQQLQGLFTAAFDPTKIPIGDDATLAGRDPAWGTFPSSQHTDVVVQLRAVGALQSGSRVFSNWFNQTIDVCVGCLAWSACTTPAVTVACPNTCSTGTCNPPANADSAYGTCDDGTVCRLTGLKGQIPNLTGLCLPYQGIDAISNCNTINQCQ